MKTLRIGSGHIKDGNIRGIISCELDNDIDKLYL